jgi:hypothetical protein
MRVAAAVAFAGIGFAAGCATAPPPLPRDAEGDLQIIARSSERTGTHEWQVQTRFVLDGPGMLLGMPVFAADIAAVQLGDRDDNARFASGFLFRLHAADVRSWLLRERELVLWLDRTERIELGEGDYDGGMKKLKEPAAARDYKTWVEVLAAPITRDELRRMAEAQVVELEAAGFRLRLHPATLEAIDRLLASVPDAVR